MPRTTDGQVVLLRQYRYTVDDWCWDARPRRRELAQEVGDACDELICVGRRIPSVRLARLEL